ncbi:hypothetical protein BU26DRAFT_318203 [Trematosphaeria pertusa]|uniref:Uncharacterized protein n=1 Tax=Trematosphaeria pertusa TaxID=390896 RepID=A0A6A6IG65_9PLEO|nr:uncharacterized protein BU26DRAFT_318203 [Trematosphaeria pertusa]KAF2249431.1 hypothetical protein BU26DRAFT_318203 [Trematosphaeria pertusa]
MLASPLKGTPQNGYRATELPPPLSKRVLEPWWPAMWHRRSGARDASTTPDDQLRNLS